MDLLNGNVTNLGGRQATDMLQGRVVRSPFDEEPSSAIQSDGAPGSVLQSFGDLLNNQIQQVNALQVDAQNSAETYATGGDIPIHTVMVATEKAELSLQFALQVRNKLVQAYQDLSHMQL